MIQAKKGIKGFQNMPPHLIKSKAYNYKMTESELIELNKYCELNDINKVDAIRKGLGLLYDLKDFNTSENQSI